jgi:hypothetical protein
MKKIIYMLILSLVVVSGLVFANREAKDIVSKRPILNLSLLLKGKLP